MLSIFSAQIGAAIAKTLFDSLGPGGTVFLRVAFAALVLLLLVRPTLGGHDRAAYLVAGLFGLALAGMNFSLYLAIDRIPVGVAVTLEFLGPLGVAVAGSRRTLDLLWVLLAATGILLLAPLSMFGGMDLEPFEPLPKEDRATLQEEGERLVRFLAEPQGAQTFEVRFVP